MTTAAANIWDEEVDLTRHYTEEERDALYEACMDALLAGDQEESDRILRVMPIHPRWAKIAAEVYGKEFAKRSFNLTHADEVYGEGWLDAIESKGRLDAFEEK